jgi:serine/threonine protein phosphatase PrpC
LDAESTSLATTLRVALVPTSGSRYRASFNVGDGDTYRLVGNTWESSDETKSISNQAGVHSTAVHTLPGQSEMLRFKMWQAEQGEVLVVCTDGLSNPLRDEEFAGHLAKEWFREPPGTIRFLWQMQSRLRSYDDDRAVACVWETRPSPPPA